MSAPKIYIFSPDWAEQSGDVKFECGFMWETDQ